jgi:hypothetical protein|tara:strand:+ start:541 stop:684 length:144 start_codon:yes stop_codon:yes gene_type:complete
MNYTAKAKNELHRHNEWHDHNHIKSCIGVVFVALMVLGLGVLAYNAI